MYVFVQELSSGPVANEILFTGEHCHGQGAGGSCGGGQHDGSQNRQTGEDQICTPCGS